jgi:starch phosphorylase
MNGAINCSVLDGWWAECFSPEVGWAISSAEGLEDVERRNEVEANSLFEMLEDQIVPLYHRRTRGVPVEWVEMMGRSISVLGPRVHAARMVRDYVAHLYRPAHEHQAALAADDHEGARRLAGWRRWVLDSWHQVHVDEVDADESVADLNTVRTVRARVALGSLGPDDVEVQVVTGIVGQAGELEEPTSIELRPVGDPSDGHHVYEAELRLEVAGRRGLTVRVVPRHPLLVDPLELGCVAWAR